MPVKKIHFFSILSSTLSILAIANVCFQPPAWADPLQTSNQNSTIGNNSNNNNVNQNAAQSQNVVNFPDRVVYPLDYPIYNPVNTENDLGFNFSAGVNTLDAANVTLYFGLIYQPGRTASHRARMAQIQKETELLEIRKLTMEAELSLLQKQVEEAELRLQRLRQSSGQTPAPSLAESSRLQPSFTPASFSQ